MSFWEALMERSSSDRFWTPPEVRLFCVRAGWARRWAQALRRMPADLRVADDTPISRQAA